MVVYHFGIDVNRSARFCWDLSDVPDQDIALDRGGTRLGTLVFHIICIGKNICDHGILGIHCGHVVSVEEGIVDYISSGVHLLFYSFPDVEGMNYRCLQGLKTALALIRVDLVVVVDPVIIGMLWYGRQAHLQIDLPIITGRKIRISGCWHSTEMGTIVSVQILLGWVLQLAGSNCRWLSTISVIVTFVAGRFRCSGRKYYNPGCRGPDELIRAIFSMSSEGAMESTLVKTVS